MRPSVDTKDPNAVTAEVQDVFLTIFPQGDPQFVPRIFGWATKCFTGQYSDYQAVDARYHDFEHTLQGTLCLARLLRGRFLAQAQPVLPEHIVRLGLLAILLHDTGYLKKSGDTEGTGAKYTVTHVHRSAEFAADLMREKGFSASDVAAVQNMIQCTGLDSKLAAIPFRSEAETIAGFALATADLLGQMAAEDYVDKLPVLYAEFAEALDFSHRSDHFIARFASAAELMDNTPAFWETFVQQKLDRDFRGLHRFLNDPYPDGPNPYFERVAANMERLKRLRQSAAPRC